MVFSSRSTSCSPCSGSVRRDLSDHKMVQHKQRRAAQKTSGQNPPQHRAKAALSLQLNEDRLITPLNK